MNQQPRSRCGSRERSKLWSLTLALLALPGAARAGTIEGDGARPAAPTGVAVPKECREIEINGPRLTGTALKLPGGRCTQFGVELDSATLKTGLALRDGRTLYDVTLEGTALRSAALGVLDSKALIGAQLLATTVSGAVVRLRIDEISSEGALTYLLSYQLGQGKEPSTRGWVSEGAFAPLCSVGERALPLAGRFASQRGRGLKSADPGIVTWACEGASLAKCALRLRYQPSARQATARGAVSLSPYHEACVRALRADYCGDGRSFTQAGTLVNLYDAIGVQRDEADWPTEADWSEGGALCVSQPRWAQLPGGDQAPPLVVREALQRICPERLRPCGKALSPGALLRTEAVTRTPQAR